jgi:hypothetical protein
VKFTSPTKRNRRRWTRRWFNASVRIFADVGTVDALGIQISEGGIYLFAVANLPVGAEVRLEYTTPPSKQPLQIAAVVRHRALYLYGLEFLQERPSHEAITSVPVQGSPS